MKKITILLIIFLFMIFMFGCGQAEQLNDRLIVQAVGVDYKENEYEVTLQVLSINSKGKESSESPKKEVEIMKDSGCTVTDAISSIREKSGKNPLFSQTLVIVIGSDAAKNGLNNFMNFFTRSYEFSPLTEILISENKASEVLSLKKGDNTIKAEDIVKISILSSNKNRGLNSNIGNVISEIRDEYAQTKALYAEITEEKDLSIDKLAIFKDDKLFDVLDDQMTKGFLLIKARTKGIYDILYSEKFSNIPYSIVKSNTKVKICQKDKLEICLLLKVDIKLVEADINISKHYSEIKELLKSKFENMVINVINQTIIKNEIEIFGFSSAYLRKGFSFKGKSPSEVKSALKNADFKVDVTVNINSDK